MRRERTAKGPGTGLVLGIAVLAGVVVASWKGEARALSLYEGERFRATLDTTLLYGLQYRLSDPDEELIGTGNGGEGAQTNWDDGDLNYDKGIVSNLAKIISELDVRGDDLGAFVRATAFYDFENMRGDRERYDLGDEAEEQVGADVRLLDAYLWGKASLGPVPVQVRVGEQVVNWGESTFIGNGIGLNTINPVDLSKLHTPGAELRDALLPSGMVWGTAGLTQGFSVEGLYAYEWEETRFDEPGTYWSFADFVGAGDKVLMADIYDGGDTPASQTFLAVPRASDERPPDQGQFGVALRYQADWLKATELSLYYLRYHSKTPVLGVRTGTEEGVAQGQAAAGAVYADAGVNPGEDAAVDALADAVFLDAYGKTMRYRTDFDDTINLFGLGWSTELFGWGFQGEISHRRDVPLQVEFTELLSAALSSINPDFGEISQLGSLEGEYGTWVPYKVKKDMTQVQFTVSKLFGAVLGAQGSAFVGEAGWLHVHGMPEKSELRLETFGPYGTGNEALSVALGLPLESQGIYPDADSFGYVLYGKLDYENALGPIALSPHLAWSHDVKGISPNGGPFVEGRKGLAVGVEGKYGQSWTADLSYTTFLGADKLNLYNDRDFIGFNVKYFF